MGVGLALQGELAGGGLAVPWAEAPARLWPQLEEQGDTRVHQRPAPLMSAGSTLRPCLPRAGEADVGLGGPSEQGTVGSVGSASPGPLPGALSGRSWDELAKGPLGGNKPLRACG